VGDAADLQLFLYNRCQAPALGTDDNAFGHSARIAWNVAEAGVYYVKLRNHDPNAAGSSTTYRLSVTLDATPPGRPEQVRLSPRDAMLAVQWQTVADEDATGYYLDYEADNGDSGYTTVAGRTTTYAELTGLRNNVRHCVRVTAFDFSGNESAASRSVCTSPMPPADTTTPQIVLTGPTREAVYTTTMESLIVQGEVQDAGGNLSRAWVRNQANNSQGWDYSLSGSSDAFTIVGIELQAGDNVLVATVYDSAGNFAADTLTVHRITGSRGAAVIVAGRRLPWDETQLNIYYATDHAYRIFRRAGFSDDQIHYLAHDPQDLDGDGESEVDLAATRANLEAVLTQRVLGQVGPGRPLWLYLMDHGDVDQFCLDDCGGAGALGPAELTDWLRQLEAATGVTEVNVIYEACHSGSFLQQPGLISASGRAVIASAAPDQFAYAVPGAGAYFSDAFFSVLGGGGTVLASFQAGETAARAAQGLQQPWLDADGDGQVNGPTDRSQAAGRYLFPAALGPGGRPVIEGAGASAVVSGSATLWAQMRWPGAAGRNVWAAVFPPGYTPPAGGIALVEEGGDRVALEDRDGDGRYEAIYSRFLAAGAYRVVLYAADEEGDQAEPRVLAVQVGATNHVYLPLMIDR
jgi:hypothetical protein